MRKKQRQGQRIECRSPFVVGERVLLLQHVDVVINRLPKATQSHIHCPALLVERSQGSRSRLVGKPFYQGQRSSVVIGGFRVAVEPGRVVAGVNQVLDGADVVSPTFKV